MNDKKLIFIDFECSCDNRYHHFDSEIIEWGCVKVDIDNIEIIDELQMFVKPIIHHPEDMSGFQQDNKPLPKNVRLSEYCKDLTTIKQSDVDSGLSFSKSFQKFGEWAIDADGFVWSSWGKTDYEILQKDCFRHSIKYLDVCKIGSWFDLKTEFATYVDGGTKRRGLRAAVNMTHQNWIGTQHRALVDAKHMFPVYKFMRTKASFELKYR